MQLTRHDGASRLILWQWNLAETTPGAWAQKPKVVGDLHQGDCNHIQGARNLEIKNLSHFKKPANSLQAIDNSKCHLFSAVKNAKVEFERLIQLWLNRFKKFFIYLKLYFCRRFLAVGKTNKIRMRFLHQCFIILYVFFANYFSRRGWF